MRITKLFIVTGASSGIGNAIARVLSERGYRVGTIDRSGTGLRSDLSEVSLIPDIWYRAIGMYGMPDTLILNAGVGLEKAFVDTDLAEMTKLLNINILGTLCLAREAIRSWVHAGKKGHVIFIGSQAALPGAKHSGNVCYTATKAALHAVVGPLATEYGPSIRVNCIAPGDVATEAELRLLRRKAADLGVEESKLQEEVTGRSALKRWVRAEEVAEAAIFLDECEAMTGAILNVSAGASVH